MRTVGRVRLGVLGESRRVRKPLFAPWERNRASVLKVFGRKATVLEMQAGRGSGTRGRTRCLAGIRAGLSMDQHVPRKMAGRREFLWSQAREPLFGAGAAKTEGDGVGRFGCCGDNLLADRALVRANARVCAPACARTLPLSVSSPMAGNGRRVAPSGLCQARAHSWASACPQKADMEIQSRTGSARAPGAGALLVAREVGCCGESLVARRALKGFFARVSTHVRRERRVVGKCHSTLLALVGSFPSVRAHVCRQLTRMRECTSTLGALVRPLRRLGHAWEVLPEAPFVHTRP